MYIYICICMYTYCHPTQDSLDTVRPVRRHRPSDAAGAQFGRSREEPHKPSMKSFKGLGFRDRIKPS